MSNVNISQKHNEKKENNILILDKKSSNIITPPSNPQNANINNNIVFTYNFKNELQKDKNTNQNKQQKHEQMNDCVEPNSTKKTKELNSGVRFIDKISKKSLVDIVEIKSFKEYNSSVISTENSRKLTSCCSII